MTAPAAQPEITTTALNVALKYNALGWPVFPCRPAPEDVADPNTGEIETRGAKTPLVSRGLKDATLNTPLIGRQWARYPGAMIGVPTGAPIGAWVLDIDVPPDHEDGRIWLAEMEEFHGPLPETRTATTASGGKHYFWRHVDGVRNRASIGSGADTRGDGGYVIAPGSVMADGRTYRWDNDLPIADAPAWLLELVLPRQAAPVAAQSFDYRPHAADRYVAASVDDELRVLAGTSAGGRGAQVNASAYNLGRFVGAGLLSRSEAEAGLFAAAQANGVVAKDGEREINAKIRRGIDAGILHPKHIPEPDLHGDDTPPIDQALIHRLIENSLRKKSVAQVPANDNQLAGEAASSQSRLSIFEWPASRFIGEAPAVEYLVDGVIPLGVPGMVSAMGDTGKSFAILELHRRVAFGQSAFAPDIFGGRVAATGTSVMITSEDDAGEVHRRIAALDAKSERFSASGQKMIVVPLPSAGGARAFWRDDRKKGLIETDDFLRMCDELRTIADLRLVTFDPLASFAHLALNEDPAAGQFVCTSLSRLASETGATVLVAHHMRKTQKPIENLGDARDAIRGSTALVDGLRLAYAMWPADEARAKRVCKALGQEYQANRVVLGGVVKANGPTKRVVSTLVRNEFGLLIDRTSSIGAAAPAQEDLIGALIVAVEAAAVSGQPLTKTGSTGLYSMRERLPAELRGVSRHRLEGLAAAAIERGDIRLCLASGTTPKWLDVPGGQFAIGLGEFRKGGVRS